MNMYYSHVCACGCGKKLKIKKIHKYYGIPKYIIGHNLIKEKGNYKHGEAIKSKKSKLYSIWGDMIQRCLNINNKRFNDWGGRGITVCDEWLDKDKGYINFRDWALNNGYQRGLEIDRIDNNGNYEPNNCRFTTSQDNSQNRRSTKLSKEKVIEIREKYKSGKYTTRQLAIDYNLKSKSTIVFIINNKTWNNI